LLKKCIDYEVEHAGLRGRLKKTWTEVIEKTIRPDNCARRMLWTAANVES